MAAMLKHHFVSDCVPSILALFGRQKSSAEDFVSVWVEFMAEEYIRQDRRVDNILQITYLVGTLMDDLLAGQGESTERRITFFISVLRRSFEVTEKLTEVISIAVTERSPIIFMAPLWSDAWKFVCQNSSHGSLNLVFELLSVGTILFPETLLSVLSPNTVTTQPSCRSALFEFLLSVSSDNNTAISVRESAILYCTRNLAQSGNLLIEYAGSLLSAIGRLLSYEPSKRVQYSLLLEINNILKINPLCCSFSSATTSIQTIDISERSLQEGRLKNCTVSFLKSFNEVCAPPIASLLWNSLHKEINYRTLTLIKSIFMSECIGVDPNLFVFKGSCPDISAEAKEIMNSIFRERCRNLDAILSVCYSLVDSYFCQSNREIDISQSCKVLTIPEFFSLDEGASIAVSISERLKCIRLDDNEFVLREKMSLVLSAILFLPFSPVSFVPVCLSFTDNLPYLKPKLQLSCPMLDDAIALNLRLVKCLLLSYPGKMANVQFRLLQADVFPDLLKIEALMHAAVTLGLSTNHGLQYIFQWIGSYQDEALRESQDPQTAIRYIDLIACVVDENAAEIKRYYQAVLLDRLSDLHSNSSLTVSKFHTFDLRETCLRSSCNLEEIVLDNGNFKGKTYKSSTNCYLKESLIYDEVGRLEKKSLCDSVLNDSSFLHCFLPFLAAIAENNNLNVNLRVAAVRALGSFMKCSADVVRMYTPVLADILFAHWSMENAIALLPLVLEAIRTWFVTFAAGVSNIALITHIVFMTCLRKSHQLHDERCHVLLLRHVVDIITALISDKKVRNPEELGFVLGVLINWAAKQKDSALYEHTCSRTLFLSGKNSKFVSRTFFLIIRALKKNIECIFNLSCDDVFDFNFEFRLSVCKSLIFCLAQSSITCLNLVAEKLIKEFLATADNQLLLFVQSFPLSDGNRALIDGAIKLGEEN